MQGAERILPAANQLGEGPLWHAQEGCLYWVDIEGESFSRWSPENDRVEVYNVGQPVGCLAFCQDGSLVLALRDGVGFWDWKTRQVEIAVRPEPDRPGARFNDGRVDSRGRLWAGTLGPDRASCLYRFDPDGTIQTMETGIEISNGLGWSPDLSTMYFTDSPRREIYAYEYDPEAGSIANRRVFVQVPPDGGFPDGLAVDAEGFVWSAHWDGWCVTRYDPEGKIDREISLPVQRPTSCAFGGSDLTQLYITSAWTGLTPTARREQPWAGDIFRLETDVQGQRENFFNRLPQPFSRP